MNIKRVLGITGASAIVLGLSAWHVLFGYVTTEWVADDVIVLQRRNIFRQIGANVTVYTSAGDSLVVDTQLRPLSSLTSARIRELVPGTVATVVVTHWHPDHSGGIAAYSGDADVVAHENVLRRLSGPQEGFGLTKPGSQHEFPARAEGDLPGVTISTNDRIRVGTTEVEVRHYPRAHTDGDLVVYIRDSDAVVVGDLIWPGSFPFIDVHNGGTVEGLEAALRQLLAESASDYRFTPGHGQPIGFDQAVEYLDMVSQTRAWVESRLDAGKSLEEIADSGLPSKWATWGSALVPAREWIRMIRDSRPDVNHGINSL